MTSEQFWNQVLTVDQRTALVRRQYPHMKLTIVEMVVNRPFLQIQSDLQDAVASMKGDR